MIERQYGFIEVAAKDHGAAWITLKNPVKKNAIGPAMVNELLWALEDAAGDDTVRSVVLTGAGDAFCAGGDFTQMASFGPGSELPPKGDYADLLSAMTNYPKPIISRVNGHAMGGGLGLVAASHFAVASRNAKLGTPEINVGLFPMMIMAVLARIVPQRRLLEMMLFGERVDADAAVGLGLVNKAVDADGLDAEVAKLAQNVAAKSPITVRLGLEAWSAQADMTLADALPMLRGKLGAVLGTDDAREGLMAFLEKRPPKWTGK